MSKKSSTAACGYKALVDAIDCGYQHSNAEMFRWMIHDAFLKIGLPSNESIPESAKPKVENALLIYERTVAHEMPFADILGPVYMDLGSRWGRQALGQFFTPQPVAIMMSMMTVGSTPSQGIVRSCDPACGSGVMMLSLAQTVLKQDGAEALKRYSFTGVDLDGICARMMALQFMANIAVHDIEVGELIVLHGNSLLPWEKMDVVVHAASPSFPNDKVAPATHPARIQAIQEAAQQVPGLQFNLFEEDAA